MPWHRQDLQVDQQPKWLRHEETFRKIPVLSNSFKIDQNINEQKWKREDIYPPPLGTESSPESFHLGTRTTTKP